MVLRPDRHRFWSRNGASSGAIGNSPLGSDLIAVDSDPFAEVKLPIKHHLLAG
jgi:hypothetical protein